MGNQFASLDDRLTNFIGRQKLFITASAAPEGRVNVSPRPTDLFRVLDANTVLYLDRTGSGNETAAHLKADGRMTILFQAFEGPPMILRLYGQGRVLHRESAEFADALAAHFNDQAPPGARQMVRLDIDLVQTSCGYGVPNFEYQGERDVLTKWAEKKGSDGVRAFWEKHNQSSLDGLPTGIFEEG